MKRPALWLRLASIMTLLFALGHTIGFSAPSADTNERVARHAMQTMSFDLAGTSVNYWGLYLGFGYSVGLFLALQSVLLWLAAGAAAGNEKASSASILAFLVCNVINLAFLLKYFFIVPQVMEGAIILFLVIALVTRRTNVSTAA
jgi:hypothetical protein